MKGNRKKLIDIILIDAFLDFIMICIFLTVSSIPYLFTEYLFPMDISELSIVGGILLAIFVVVPVILFIAIYAVYEKKMCIPEELFIVEKGKGKVFIKWEGKYNFVISKYIKDIKKYHFEYDVTGKAISYLDRTRLFFSLQRYKIKKIEDYQERREKQKIYSKDTILRNKKMVKELDEHSIGVRKATDSEMKDIEGRFLLNKVYLIMYIVVIPMLIIPYKLVIIGGILLVTLSVIIMNCFTKIFKVRNATYLIIECDILEKFNYNAGSAPTVSHFKVRCRDKKKLYIDDWFECDYETYKGKKINIVVVKQKNGKTYINSFDNLWRTRPYIIRSNI